jgi:cell division protein FtsB
VEKPDKQRSWETTTAILRRRAPGLAWLPSFLRQRLTPVALWGAIGILAVSIAYVVNAQRDLNRHQESITDLQRDRAQDRDMLQQIVNSQTAMSGKIDTLTDEMNRQRDWREKIEEVAESGPHAKRHK